MADIQCLNSCDVRLAEPDFSTVLHVIDGRVNFRFIDVLSRSLPIPQNTLVHSVFYGAHLLNTCLHFSCYCSRLRFLVIPTLSIFERTEHMFSLTKVLFHGQPKCLCSFPETKYSSEWFYFYFIGNMIICWSVIVLALVRSNKTIYATIHFSLQGYRLATRRAVLCPLSLVSSYRKHWFFRIALSPLVRKMFWGRCLICLEAVGESSELETRRKHILRWWQWVVTKWSKADE